VPISDAWIEDNAIAISTHGRSFYVLDDLATLRQAPETATVADAHLFKPVDAIRGAGGATITYLLKNPAQKLTLEVLDASGAVIYTAEGARPQARGEGGGRGQAPAEGRGGRGRGGPPAASMAAGLNRVNWNLQYPGATTFPGMVLWGASTSGPAAVPGTYQVRLTVDGKVQTQPLVVKRHPLRSATDADLKEQFDLAIQVRDKVSEANNAVIRIRKIKEDVKDRLSKSQDAQLKSAADRLVAGLSAVEQDIYQVKNQSGQDPLNFPIKTNNRFASLLGMTLRGEGKPTANIYPIFEDLKKELKAETDRLQQVLSKDLAAFNTEATRAGVEPVPAGS
jgi:hypothetical protein